jgi:hypothetical protein
MVIAGLVMGILSVSVFFWAGPTIGGLWAGSQALSSSLGGGSAIPATGPIWAVGLTVGVGLPAISLFLSIAGMMKGQSKGVGIAGIVTSAVGAILGFMTTAGAAFAINIASTAKDSFATTQQQGDVQQMQNTLNDPNFQNQIQQALDAAAKQNPNAQGGLGLTGTAPSTAPAPSANTLMPGQVPSGSLGAANPASPAAPAEAVPAEAPIPAGASAPSNTAVPK